MKKLHQVEGKYGEYIRVKWLHKLSGIVNQKQK